VKLRFYVEGSGTFRQARGVPPLVGDCVDGMRVVSRRFEFDGDDDMVAAIYLRDIERPEGQPRKDDDS
jgi:hypothetical protein